MYLLIICTLGLVRPILQSTRAVIHTLLGNNLEVLTSDHFGVIHALLKSNNLQKSVNLKHIMVGRLDEDMIVPPSDGAMFILID